jgi:hypothetical protein
MSSETDKEQLIEKHFPTPGQRLALEYVAERAANRVMAAHAKQCPFEQRLYGIAGKAIIGLLVGIGAAGAIAWGWLTHSGGGK